MQLTQKWKKKIQQFNYKNDYVDYQAIPLNCFCVKLMWNYATTAFATTCWFHETATGSRKAHEINDFRVQWALMKHLHAVEPDETRHGQKGFIYNHFDLTHLSCLYFIRSITFRSFKQWYTAANSSISKSRLRITYNCMK